jgi:hypothetical protein
LPFLDPAAQLCWLLGAGAAVGLGAWVLGAWLAWVVVEAVVVDCVVVDWLVVVVELVVCSAAALARLWLERA